MLKYENQVAYLHFSDEHQTARTNALKTVRHTFVFSEILVTENILRYI